MAQDEEALRVPYGPDFTPGTLGKVIGEDKVLRWLLEQVATSGNKSALSTTIGANCLSHIEEGPNRRDMASHVVQGLTNYRLIETAEDGTVKLAPIGEKLRVAPDAEIDVLFARHIVASCNGQRLIDAVRRYELRGETPTLEDLANELDVSATAKNVSTARAWLARAGVFSATGRYRINEGAYDKIVGTDTAKILGIDPDQLEFILAARLLERERGAHTWLMAKEVADLVDARSPDFRGKIKRKSLTRYVDTLRELTLVETGEQQGSTGGKNVTLRLVARAADLADDELRGLLGQAEAGFPLAELRPLDEVVKALADGTGDEIGRMGEMLAVHLCLMLGLRVVHWRKRAPHSEIDLIAERLTGLTYQRWAVQVKNTGGDLDNDRVDREVGATVGIGTSHILFLVPRALITTPALGEIRRANRLTALHVYYLSKAAFSEGHTLPGMLSVLHQQERGIMLLKQDEAQRREDL